VYDQWVIDTDECEAEDMICLEDYFQTHLPNIGVYPIEMSDVTVKG